MKNRNRREFIVDSAKMTGAAICAAAIGHELLLPLDSEASDFVTTNQNALSKLPVAYFLTCLTLSIHTDEARRKAMTFLDPLHTEAPQVKPVSVGRFAGVLDYSKLSFM